MITQPSHAYTKNKCNLFSRSDGGADLLTWSLNNHADYSFLILPFYCNACSVHLEKTTDKNLVEKGTKLYKKTHKSLVRATETLRHLY